MPGRRLDRAVSSPAAARTPCWDRLNAPAASRLAALQPMPTRSVQEPQAREPQVRESAQERQSSLALAAGPAVSSRAAARRPCWDPPSVPVALPPGAPRQRPSRSVSVRTQEPKQPRPFLRRRMPQSDREVPSPAAARTPCWDHLAIPARPQPPPARVRAAESRRPSLARLSQVRGPPRWPFRRRQKLRSDLAVPSRAAARMPCWDPPVESAPRWRPSVQAPARPPTADSVLRRPAPLPRLRVLMAEALQPW